MNGKLPKGTLDKLWSDPENWRGNACYYCKDDPRIVVYKRHKWMGYTFNAAHGSAWLAILLIVGYPLGMILWLARTPEAYLLISCWEATSIRSGVFSNTCRRRRGMRRGVEAIRDSLSIFLKTPWPAILGYRDKIMVNPNLDYIRPATILTNMARMAVLKAKEIRPWTVANRRMVFEEICTSETWQVIPMTKEK